MVRVRGLANAVAMVTVKTKTQDDRGRIQLENSFPPKRGDEFNLKNVSRQDERSKLCSESDQLPIGSD
jgi:hypothetical protein